MWITALLISLSCADTSVHLALNWKPEPEFGGFYAAQKAGDYAKQGLKVEILPGGAGEPVAQMVAAGKSEFGISSGDEVVMSQSHGADVVALFAVYQISPMILMAHRSQGFKTLGDIFKRGGTLAMEQGLPYYKFLEKIYGMNNVKVVPYVGGIAAFLHDPHLVQQGFLHSEPLIAKKHGADPQSFLISEVGYDPYAEVVITNRKYLEKNKETVSAFLRAIKDGWTKYLRDPKPANEYMHSLNEGMDLDSFTAGAAAQKPLIENIVSHSKGLGHMSLDRWKKLVDQLLELKIIDQPVDPERCFEFPK